jgi:hypothetical protein
MPDQRSRAGTRGWVGTVTDQLQIVAPSSPPEDGATLAPPGAPIAAPQGGAPTPGGAITPRPSLDHVLRGMCGECGKWPNIDTLTLNMQRHNYRKSDVKGRRGRCAGVGCPPISYSWVIPLVK